MTPPPDIQREKKMAALASVSAAIGLTTLKIVVALLTGSLGILAEAAHSGLDLVAALLTFWAVRVADQPADSHHTYGRSKVENLSAFLESLLLLLTAAWVIYEALERLMMHTGQVEISIWAFAVMIISMIVDITRSRMLMRVAKKVGSQALEADALHFRTDLWSSAVVIIGLLVVYLARTWHLPIWLEQADAFAALGVSGIVLWVSIRLARETIDALVDKAPGELAPLLQQQLENINEVSEVRRVRIRRAGNKYFADVIIAAPRTLSFEQTHQLSTRVEKETSDKIRDYTKQSDTDVVVHIEPMATPGESVVDQIHYQAEQYGVHAHDIHVREVAGKLEADFDLEVYRDMDLADAHALATALEQTLLQNNTQLKRVTTHLEAPEDHIVQRQDVTEHYPEIAHTICTIADSVAGTGSAHDIRLYRPEKVAVGASRYSSTAGTIELDVVLHTIFDADKPLSQVHIRAEKIKRALRHNYPKLNNITIHTEPPEK